MRGSFVVLAIIAIIVLSCSDEDVPAGIYHYQVERLLSGQTGAKTWSQIINSSNCVDSVKLVFNLVANSSGDSLDVSIISGCTTNSITTQVGRANASKLGDGQLFTDSLIFSTGTFWLINQITSEQLQLTMDGETLQYSSN